MRRPRWQKVIADLVGNPTRSLLVVASVAVGLFALGVMATIYAVSMADIQRGYQQNDPANIAIQTSLFSQGLVDRIAEVDGMRQAQAVRLLSTRLQTSPGKWTAIDIQGINDPAEMQINRLTLLEGSLHPGDGEIVLDSFKLPETNARLGDQITVELPSGKTRQLKLVGVSQDQTIGAFRGNGGYFNAPVQGYVNQNTLELLEQQLPKRFNNLFLTVEGDSTDQYILEEVSAEVRDVLEKTDVQIYSTTLRSSTDHPNLYLARALLDVLIVIGIFIVFLSGFLITNTLQALLNQQVQQIGVMKTIGASRKQIIGVYMVLILVFSLIALAAAVPLSKQAAFALLEYLAERINFRLQGFRQQAGPSLRRGTGRP